MNKIIAEPFLFRNEIKFDKYQILSLICFQQNVCLASKTNVSFETLVAQAKRFYLTVLGKYIIITRLTPSVFTYPPVE